jgi:hypothetical protein
VVYAPEVIVPRNSTSKEMISVALGKLTLKNEFLEIDQQIPVEKLQLSVNSVSVKSVTSRPTQPDIFDTVSLVNELKVKIDVERLLQLSLREKITQFKVNYLTCCC